MDTIINKLSEIEAAAAAIVEHAEAQKAVLDQEYHDKTQKFDEELEAKTQAKLQVIKDELEKTQASLLSGQEDTSSESIDALKKEYEEKHTQYAQDILKRITSV